MSAETNKNIKVKERKRIGENTQAAPMNEKITMIKEEKHEWNGDSPLLFNLCSAANVHAGDGETGSGTWLAPRRVAAFVASRLSVQHGE